MVTSPNTVSTICDTGLGVHAFRVQALAVDRNGYLYAGTDTGIYRSTDDGNHWIWSNLPDTISSIAASSNGYIYAQTFYDSYDSSATYISYDTGATWKYLNSDLVSCGLYSSPTNAIIGLGSYNDTSRTDYVFSLDIVTGHWFRIDQELPADHQYYSIAIDSSGYIYAADENNGIYRTTSPVTSVYEENNVIASAFNLSPNYPNPFSEMTNVEYQIPVEGFVTLKVYNTLGEEVATLVNGEQSAGEHSAAFNASGLRNGVYFYRLTAGKYSQTGKMCVVK
ncbi:MAG TPA: T9SS type A sorting domain-containing protein [Candidatus Kapabacteria bacterium]|nr:T9SS type A sorting domain-containing protein [Candidatus Kapabacteria bacterium]